MPELPAHESGFPGRVTLLTNFVPPYLVALFAELAKRVSDLEIFVSTRMESNRPWEFQGEGLPVHVQRTLTLSRTWRHPAGFREAQSLHFPLDTLALLHRHRPDVIVTTEFGFRTVQAVIHRRLHARTAVVAWAPISELTEQSRGRFREGLRRWLLRRVDAVVVTSESGARYIRRRGFPDHAIFQVPHTTDGGAFAGSANAPGERRAPRRLLYVGQLIERKAVAEFLSALSGWAETDRGEVIEFWIVGDGPLRAALESQRVPASLRVKFFGSVSYADLPSYYARAGMLVFPTLADEWGLVVNEAMAAGVPVLGSRNSQAVEAMVEDGETGWTFSPDQPEEIASALDRAFSTPLDRLGVMRDRCRARARAFTPEAAAGRMLEAIECAASARSRAASGPPTCPLCRGHASALHVLPHTTAWQCAAADCKLRFAAPQPSDGDLHAAYRALYYPERADGATPACESTPSAIHRELIRYLTGTLGAAHTRVLDYGCGHGALAGAAREAGLEAFGIEPDPQARASAEREGRLPVFEDIAALRRAQPETRFDAIVLWQVIEHLREPWAELTRLRDLLSPTGRLVVATPNSRGLKARVQRARWENFANPTHLYYFTDASLARVARQSGLAIEARIHVPDAYPHHGALRRLAQSWLRASRLDGDLLFVLRARD